VTYYYSVGTGGAATSNTALAGIGGDSWFNTANSAPTSTAGVLAKGGGRGVNNSTTAPANGGSATSGFGTIKYSGGTGRQGTTSGGGGGGASAGTNANGTAATTASGAIAGLNGGNGGNSLATTGPSQSGTAPGGGGGGSDDISGFASGAGANGRIVISVASIPWTEGFENGYADGITVGWNQTSVTGTQVWTANSSVTTYNRTPRTGSFNAFLQYSNEDWLFYPVQLTGGTNYTFEVFARQDMATSTDANITLAYGSSASAASMTTITGPTGIVDGNYQSINGTFTPSTSGVYYMGIKGFMNGTPWYISIDDISVKVSPTCAAQPSSLTSSITSTTTATLSWTAASPAPGSGYDIYYSTSSTAPTAGTTATTTTAAGVVTKNITGLLPNTTYYWWVRSNCNGTDKSAWVSGGTFSTLEGSSCGLVQDLALLTSPFSGTTIGFSNNFTTSCLNGTGGDRIFKIDVPAGAELFIGQSTNAYDSKHRIAYGGSCPGTTEINTGYLGNLPTQTTNGTIAGCLDDNDLTHYYFNNNTGSTQTVYWIQDGFSSGQGTFTLEWVVVTPLPTITSFTPSTVCASSNQTVTITGTNFTGASSVSIGGTAAQSFVVNSATQITATVGAGATGQISVTTPYGTANSTASVTVQTVTATPTITTPVCANATTIVGTSVPNATVVVTVNGVAQPAVVADAGGAWTRTVSALTAGQSVTATAQGTGQCVSASTSSVTITTCTTPTIFVSTTGLNAFEACINTASTEQTFTVSGSNLTGNISVTAPTGFQISTTSGSGFGTSLTLIQSGGTVTTTTIYARMAALSSSPANGDIACTSSGATQRNVAVSGSVSPASVGGSISGGTTPICFNESTGIMTLSGHTGTVVRWEERVNAGAWSNIANTATTYSEVPSSAGTWEYRALVQSGSCPAAYSAARSIVVNPGPTISTQPVDQNVLQGASITYTVVASGTPTYQWQYSTSAGGTYTNVANGTPAGVTYTGATGASLTVSTGASTPAGSNYFYRCVVTGGGCPTNSNAANMNVITYCTPTYSSGGSTDNITNVTLGTLVDAPPANTTPYYFDRRSVQNAVPTLVAGSNYSISITMGSDPNQFSRIWIDFNQNGTFEASESFSTGISAGAGGTATISFTVPSGATVGATRLRVRAGDDSQITDAQACGASGSAYGQALDYNVNICASVPTPGAISGPATPCQGSSQTYSIAAVSGATSYTWTLPSGWTGSSTTTSITVTVGATGGNVSVVANSSCGSSSAQTLATTVSPLPAVPTASAGSNQACTSFSANWSAAANATGYFLDVSTVNTFASFVAGYNNLSLGNVTTASVTGLNAGSTYFYRVRSTNACGTSTNSSTITVSTLPATPAAPAASAATNLSCSGFSANWAASSNATGYFLDVSTVSNFATFVAGYNNLSLGNVTTASVTGLSASTTYYYRVRASNTCGTSASSSTITALTTPPTPSAPVALDGSNPACTSFSANWSASSNATAYSLDVSTVNTFATFVTGFSNLNVGNVTTYSVTGLTAGTTYFYRVRATNACGTSGNSSTITYGTSPTVGNPGAISGSSTPCNGSSQTYSISPVANATSYTWTLPGGWTGTSTTNSITATVGSSGNISVVANNACGSSTSSTLAVTVGSVPAQPSAIAGTLDPEIGLTQAYSVTNVAGVTYSWSFSGSSGWSVASGQGTNAIVATVGIANTTITVTPSNGCGNGTARTITTTIPAYRSKFVSSNYGASTWCAGTTRSVTVTVKNNGTAAWTDASPDINVGLKWNGDGTNWLDYFYRQDGGNLAPGATGTFTFASVEAANATATGVNSNPPTYGTDLAVGSNNLTFDVVNEANCWFGNNNGSCGPGNVVFTTPAITIDAIPAQPSTISASAAACVGGSVTYSVTNVSGVTYTWSVPSGWAITSGQGTSSLVVSVGASSGTVSVVPSNGCGSGTARSTSVTPGNDCQCLAYPSIFASNPADEDITNVTVGTMNNSSTCATLAGGPGSILNRYSNYAGIVTGPSVQQNASVNFSLTQTTCGGNFSNFFQIYVDYNQDGDFLDAGEQVYSQPTSTSGNHTKTGSFTVPCNALTGTTRMRVVNIEAAASTTNYAHTVYSYGETEDYCFTITTGSANPVVTCPGNLNLASGTSCTAVGTYTATTNIGTLSYTFSGATTGSGAGTGSGSSFNKGVTNVTVVSTNGTCTGSCDFVVTVSDNTNPVVSVPSNITVNNDPGTCGATVTYSAPMASDNCETPQVPVNFNNNTSQAIPDFQGNTPGVVNSLITVSGVNNSLNSNSLLNSLCLNINHVYDGDVLIELISPAGTTLQLSNRNGAGGDNYTNTCFTRTATTAITSGTPPYSGNFIPQGAGGFGVFNGQNPNGVWTLRVSDQAAGDLGTFLNWSLSFGNIQFTINRTAGLASGSVFPVGVTTNTFSTTDAAGNVGTSSFTVTVVDNQNPVLTCPTPAASYNADAGECNHTRSFTATASDNCSVQSIAYSVGGTTVTFPYDFPVGSTTVTALATDVNANMSNCTFAVVVNDNQLPSITCPVPAASYAMDAGECNHTRSFVATSSDNCSVQSVAYSVGGTGITFPYDFPVGSTTVTAVATDPSNNSRSCTFAVVVNDNQNPVITCPTPSPSYNADAGECNFTTSFVANSSDNCSVQSVAYSVGGTSISFPYDFPVGSTTVTVVATDVNANTSNCTFAVVVNDNQNPAITCPVPAASYNADAGECNFTTSFAATASDNCSVQSVAYSVGGAGISFPYDFPVGSTTVTALVTDVNANTSNCTFAVVVQDLVQPVATCQNVSVVLNNSGTAAVTEGMIDNGSSDACGVASLSVAPNSFNCAQVGANTVTLTVTDLNGNVNACTATVTVVDNSAPSAICQNATVSLGAGGTVSISAAQIDNGSSDLCGSTTLAVSPSSFACVNQGSNTVTLTVSDPSGNSSSCNAVVTVVDNSVPVAQCRNISVQLDSSGYKGITPQMVDNGSFDACGSISLGLDRTGFFGRDLGVNVVTLKVEDTNRNLATCQAQVTVQDLILPTLTCPANQVLAPNSGCQYFGSLGTPIFWDNIGILGVGNNVNGGLPLGTNLVVWTVTDSAGNSTTCQQTVNVVDAVAPSLTCPANITVTANNGCNYVGGIDSPIASDNCALSSLSNNAPFILLAGPNVVVWTATDLSGNVTTCSQTILVADQIAPQITCPPMFIVNTNTACTYVGAIGTATATDVCGIGSIVSNAPAAFPVGVSVVTWTATDLGGNIGTCSQTVRVQDASAPVVTCPSTQTLIMGASCSLPLPDYTGLGSASDNCGVVSYGQSPAAGSSVFGSGPITVTLRATDAAGNATDCSFTVDKIDNTPPVAICPANQTLVLNSNCEIAMPNYSTATAGSDNCRLANVTQVPVAGGMISGSGTQTVTLTATDYSGNTSTCSFTITKIDNTAPVITCPANISQSVSCAPATIVLTNATGVDACGGNVAITRSYTSSTFPAGVTSVIWTATDQSGNSSICTQSVTVGTPEIEASGNGNAILNRGNNTSPLNNTNFGSVQHCSGSITKTFVITNSGSGALLLNGAPVVKVTGANASDFMVTAFPATTIQPGGSSSFQVVFNPASPGTKVARLVIANTDCDEAPFQFAIVGQGTNCNGNGSVAAGNGPGDIREDIQPESVDQTIGESYGTLDQIEAISEWSAAIVPNPNMGSFELIIGEKPWDEMDLLIVNEFGQIVHKGSVQQNQTSFELQHLPAGLYYLQLVGEKERKTIRFVKL
jgi:subtilisin-like proprotein convertase family protein